MIFEYSKKIIFYAAAAFVLSALLWRLTPVCRAGGDDPVFAAIDADDVVGVRKAIERGAKVDSRNESNETPLMVASFNGYSDIVSLLISKGADVNAKGEGGVTSLMLSAVNGSNDVVTARILIEGGADVNAKDANGNSAASIARNKGSADVVTLLESSGASFGVNLKLLYSAAGLAGAMILMIAIRNIAALRRKKAPSGLKKAVSHESGGSGSSQGREDSEDPSEGHPEGGKDFSKINVIEMIDKGNIQVLRDMIDSGFLRPDHADKSGWTILMEAANKGDLEIVKLLVESGADVNAKDRDGKTALINAAYWQRTEIIKYLVYKKAYIDIKGGDGRSALEVARDKGNDKTVKLLLSLGAIDESNKGRDAAPEVSREEMAGQLLAKVNGNDADGVRALIKSGADVNAADQAGVTPLMHASGQGFVEVARLLIAAGADVNAVSRKGVTPLILAAGRGHAEMVVLLVKIGADVNFKSQNGATALKFAVKNGHDRIAAALRKVGAAE